MRKIILASASPRRKELLTKYNIVFEVVVGDVDETVNKKMQPQNFALEISKKKAVAVANMVEYDNADVIAADTIVSLEGVIFGKPKDKNDAKRILMMLSEKWHEVYTGVTIVFIKDNKHTIKQDVLCTKVKFRKLSEDDVEEYVNSGEPMDKAGAYAIQGDGAKFVEQIDGDYENVIGLPTKHVIEMLNSNY